MHSLFHWNKQNSTRQQKQSLSVHDFQGQRETVSLGFGRAVKEAAAVTVVVVVVVVKVVVAVFLVGKRKCG